MPGEVTFHIRYAGGLSAVTPAIRAAVRETDARIALSVLQTMDAAWNAFTSPIRLVAGLLEGFSLCALALASIGLYAVIAFHTASRTREFGIRMALGASPAQTLITVLRDGIKLTITGLAVGLALSVAASRAVASLLFGAAPAALSTYAPVAAILIAVAVIATYIPAHRAAHADPTQALRHE
jgi:ABC-type antimicrobial peptide transport system permease subunit